jgi:mitofusin
MPSDQQPCTTTFCEVLDAETYNNGKEEIHAVKDGEKYEVGNEATFDRFTLDQVNEVQDSEVEYQIVKAYVIDSRAQVLEATPNPSFIKNGLVSISLIDAPGLNRDTLSTTALFARQAEIDVIVFVVSAENHFTLSAKEFLWNASQEKAYVFIVVNKWKGIKDKARCMRIVGEQIKQLSPATWEARNELVHFVDAAEMIDFDDEDATTTHFDSISTSSPSFDHLEHSLRSFVLLKRSKSKLAPAQHYLLNLLADLSTLGSANLIAAATELAEALRNLERVKPIHERLSAQRDEVEEGVDKVEESVVERVRTATWSRLERAVGYISNGLVVPPVVAEAEADGITTTGFEGVDSILTPTELPVYPGVLGVWSWAEEVKKTLVRALEAEIRGAEDSARIETVAGVQKVMTELGDKYLPRSSSPSTEVATEQQRVFRPEVMFAKRRRGVGKLAARGMGIGLSLGVAGLGTGWTAQDFDLTLFDLFDLERLYKGGKVKPESITVEEDVSDSSVVSVISVGLGALSLFGSRAVTVKGAVEAIASVCDLLGSKSARKWAGPAVGIICTLSPILIFSSDARSYSHCHCHFTSAVGLAVYIIIDLPRAIPRNIGRKLRSTLSSSLTSPSASSSYPTPAGPPTSFTTAHSDRIARETRKVLRLAGWDLRERFRAALAKSESERKEVEAGLEKSEKAKEWLEIFLEKVERTEEGVTGICL